MGTSSTARPIVLNSPDFARGLQGFRLRVATELQSTGISELDALLQGGVPRGSIIEVCGSGSSGRTSLTFSLLAKATEQQEACAYVDVSDALDPMSLASAGVDLRRVLWVRCGAETNAAARPAEPVTSGAGTSTAQNGGFGFLDKASAKIKRHGILRHPRDQIRGVEESIPSVLQSVGGGRPRQEWPVTVPRGARAQANGVEVVARCAGEQAEFGLRRGGRSERLQIAEETVSSSRSFYRGRSTAASRSKPWKKLEQALKSTDILLHSGGWGVVVFDLGNISWVDARRMELSTWFRFRRAIENTPTILLLLGEDTCAKSCSSLVLQCERKSEKWNCSDLRKPTEGIATLEGFEVEGEIMCSRMGLQPMESAQWTTRTLWTDSF
jgi:recombination protein RecA